MMYVYDARGELLYWETVELSLSRLLPGETLETENHIPFSDQLREGYQIGIGITVPDEQEHLYLAMDGEIRDGVQILEPEEE